MSNTEANKPVTGESGGELRECPFCGSTPELPYTNNVGETYARLKHSEGCCLGLGETYRQEHWIPGVAFTAWNTRAALPVDSVRTALREAVDAIFSGQLVSVGAMKNVYQSQIYVKDVVRWNDALTAALPESQPAEPTWLAEMKKAAAMFPYFSWPNCMSFSEAIAEQLVQMTRLDPAATQPAWQPTSSFPEGTLYLLRRQLAKLEKCPCATCSGCIEILGNDIVPIVDSIIERLPPTQPLDFCYAEGDEGSQFCGSPKVKHCHVVGTTAYWESFAGQQHLVECSREDYLTHHQFVATVIEQRESLRERLTDNEQMLQRQIETFNLEWAKKREAEQECERLRERLVESERRYHLVLSQIWEALGVSEYDGKHVVEHVSELRARLAEVEKLVYVPKVLPDDDQVTYAEHAESLLRRLTNARTAAFNEAIEAMKAIPFHMNSSSYADALIALTALRDEQPEGGSDGK